MKGKEKSTQVKQAFISVFLPDLRAGGAEIVHLALAKAWVEYGATVEFVVMKKRGELLTDFPTDIQIVELNADRIRNTIVPLRDYLKSRRPDVLVAAMWPLTTVAVLALKLSKAKSMCVLCEHTLLSEAYRSKGYLHNFLMKLSTAVAYRIADSVVAVSKSVERDLESISGVSRKKISVIYNPAARGVDFELTSGKNSESKQMAILTVGSLKESKNHHLLVQAFSLLSKSLNAKLVILGEGSMRESVQQLVSELGLTSKVCMPGYIEDPYEYYRKADLFVLSANYEGFGNVLVEALECGLPIVSTDCPGGPREILDNGKYGELVPVDDVSAMASAMERVLANPPAPVKQNSRATLFIVEVAAKKYFRLFGLIPKQVPSSIKHENCAP